MLSLFVEESGYCVHASVHGNTHEGMGHVECAFAVSSFTRSGGDGLGRGGALDGLGYIVGHIGECSPDEGKGAGNRYG